MHSLNAGAGSRGHRGGLSIAVAAVSGALALGACGSSGQGGTATSAGNVAALRFANCMRSHGVPNFPDPGQQGGFQFPDGGGIKPSSPAFQTAQHACVKLAPGGGPPQATSESDKLAALAFAKCMRKHGMPDFPDPTLSPTGAGPALVLRGMVFPAGLGFTPGSPAFRQAMTACGVRPPPSGAARPAGP